MHHRQSHARGVNFVRNGTQQSRLLQPAAPVSPCTLCHPSNRHTCTAATAPAAVPCWLSPAADCWIASTVAASRCRTSCAVSLLLCCAAAPAGAAVVLPSFPAFMPAAAGAKRAGCNCFLLRMPCHLPDGSAFSFHTIGKYWIVLYAC